ncbi:predicted protein [Arabidopsis lyrata subsp. lyrata]|uniref:Predicted protein n=1 Tax=Arabidopsis lyrata subsp. lyrata TaxID=81972 RepID=D7MXV9_ARALL|nr:predicted protein [Arabidopsis lyrata subsp. lyrata]
MESLTLDRTFLLVVLTMVLRLILWNMPSLRTPFLVIRQTPSPFSIGGIRYCNEVLGK